MSGMSSERPSTALAGVAASLPLVFVTVGCMILPLASGGVEDAMHQSDEMGPWFWILLFGSPIAAIICGVCLFLAGRGMRVPAVVAVGTAALPWICGVAGMRTSTALVTDAVAHADSTALNVMIAKGVSESLNARAFGGWLTAGLLAGVGFGLALAAIGQRAPRRSGAGAAVGVAAAVPLAGLAVYALVGGAGASGMWLLLPALGAFVALALAGFGAGADEAGRSSALAASTSIAMVLSFVAAAVAATTAARMKIFGALAMVDSSSRMSMIGAAVEELTPLARVATWGGLVGLIGVAAIAGWCLTRSKPSVGRIVGGAALVLVAALVPAIDAWANAASGATLGSIAGSPWDHVEGFEPIVLDTPHAIGGKVPAAIVARDGAYFGDEKVPLERDALAARFEEALAGELAGQAEDAPEWLKKRPGSGGGTRTGTGQRYGIKGPGPREEAKRLAREQGILGALRGQSDRTGYGSIEEDPKLGVAVDARLSDEALRTLLEGASAAGARTLHVTGSDLEPPPAEQSARMRSVAPLLVMLSRGASTHVEILLEGALPEGSPEQDAALYHAEIGGDPAVMVSTREGAHAVGGELSAPGSEGYDPLGPSGDEPPLFVRIGDGATARSVLTAVVWASADYRPVLVAGEIPGNPDQPLGPDTGGGSHVRGSLDKNVIRRVIRRHIGEARFCYEKELAHEPALEGKITVEFIISPTGKVQSAAVVDESTMKNSEVEECLVKAVQRWQFPEPEGGGIVVVKYPFQFRSG